jgi:G3E family GTPase
VTHDTSPPVPVIVLTGFLGSGKTTLLARLLRDPAMAGTAVIINEFGEIGLDHHLLERLEGETVLLDSGCICCSVRDGLAATLRGLLERARTGLIPPFHRIVIETTGLADPAPILATVLAEHDLAAALTIAAVVTTVDSVHGLEQLDAHLESERQIGVADRIVLTKGDLAHPAVVWRLRKRLAELNPNAQVLAAVSGAAPAEVLLAPAALRPALHAMPAPQCPSDCGHDHTHGNHGAHGRHDARVRSHVVTFDTPLQWEVVSHWLGSLAFFHGDRLLRIKGLLAIDGETGPVAVHGVRHLVHEPVTLRAWPDEDHGSRVVFITCDLGREPIEAALRRAQVDTQGERQPEAGGPAIATPLAGNKRAIAGARTE